MGILEAIIEELEDANTLDEQVRELCDKIADQESSRNKHALELPDGPNVFLSLEVPGRNKKELAFLTLEREMPEKYITGMWSKSLSDPEASLKKIRIWESKEVKAAKILKEYASIIKYLRGE